MQHAIPLSQQLQYYREYQSKLAQVAGSQKASSIISEALYVLSAGSSDFVQNYYVNPWLYKVYSPDEFASFLVSIFSSFVKVSTFPLSIIYVLSSVDHHVSPGLYKEKV